MLVDGKHFKYITIDPGIYEVDDLCFPPVLLEKLPPFPAGDWNCGRISQTPGNPRPFFAETVRKSLPSISPLWHSKSYDYLSFKIGERLKSNVYTASSSQFKSTIIAKFARFYWEIGYYVAETQAYSWIDGHNIGPEFLGYLTEDGRVIGFLIEYVKGRHATISDRPACEVIARRLHGLGILHGDLNKHNFLITERDAVLIDYETAKQSDDSEAMQQELEGLEAQLLDESGTSGVVLEEDT
jgi:predicted Ser/Thr protein kinase